MAFEKKTSEREGTGVFTLQGAVVFCGRCGRGVRLQTTDLTGGPYRCRKCGGVYCGRCFSEFNGLCLNDVGSKTLDEQEFLREQGLSEVVSSDTEPNVVIEAGGHFAHYNGQTRKVISGNGWKFDEHWLCITQDDGVRDKVDSTEVTKIYSSEPEGKLVKAIREWNRKYRLKQLPSENGRKR